MGRWRRWSLNGIPTVLQSPIYLFHKFLCSSPRFVIPFFPSCAGYCKSSESFVNDVPHCPFIEILFLLDLSDHFQCPSRPADLALYSILPFPIKNRRNRYPVWSPLSNVRCLDSSLSSAMAEMLLPFVQFQPWRLLYLIKRIVSGHFRELLPAKFVAVMTQTPFSCAHPGTTNYWLFSQHRPFGTRETQMLLRKDL